jgi:hypothetical protein
MIMHRSPTSQSFALVANRVLRGVLESRSGEVEPAQMRQALKRTLAALLRDEITNDPALYRALSARAAAAQRAYQALASNRPPIVTARYAGSGAFNDAWAVVHHHCS